jgi:hypothetical protein
LNFNCFSGEFQSKNISECGQIKPKDDDDLDVTKTDLLFIIMNRVFLMKFIKNKNLKAIEEFEKMDLREGLLKGINAYGLKKPLELQQRVVMPCIQG